MLKFCAVWLPVMLLAVAMCGCEPEVREFEIDENGKMVEVDPQAETPSDPTADNKTEDEEIAKGMQVKGKYAEAKEWLAPEHKDHVLFEGTHEAARKMVEDFYAAGAAKIYAEVNQEPMYQLCGRFVIELPTDAAARKRVIAVHDKFFEEEDPDDEAYKTVDTGQKYLTFSFD